MSFLTSAGSSNASSYHPVMTGDTTRSSYWLNWRVMLCSLWVLISVVISSAIVARHEGSRNRSGEPRKEGASGVLYKDEVWKPCLKGIHPVWLLGFRFAAFCVMLVVLIVNTIVDGADIFYYYTQWTSTLVTVYFGVGSLLSAHGCYGCHNKVGGVGPDNDDCCPYDAAEQGGIHHASGKTKGPKDFDSHGQQARGVAGFWGYAFQVIFQMNAGAVVLTDCVFWFIIVPFLTKEDHNLSFLIITMHTINAAFLLGDTALNSLRFPWFRISYFFLWTASYVIFQWILHACISLWWPYPFLDLSSPYSPLWYSVVAIMHIPCYGFFMLIIKLKRFLLSRYFPRSNYQPAR